MDPNHLASNTVVCKVCSTSYLASSSCRLFGTEPCAFGIQDPRVPSGAHDFPCFEDDLGRTSSGVIDLNQEIPGFKSEEHMPASYDSTKTPAKQNDSKSK